MKICIRNQQRHRPLNKARIQKTARTILSHLEQSTAELSIFFVGDRKMKQLNSDYRGINKATDVLSFETALPVHHGGGTILGDVVINIPRVESQAKEYGTTFYEELFRLLVHGTLHLLGYEHEASYYRARKMRNKEEELLNKCL